VGKLKEGPLSENPRGPVFASMDYCALVLIFEAMGLKQEKEKTEEAPPRGFLIKSCNQVARDY
jgi:hypothetical protein